MEERLQRDGIERVALHGLDELQCEHEALAEYLEVYGGYLDATAKHQWQVKDQYRSRNLQFGAALAIEATH